MPGLGGALPGQGWGTAPRQPRVWNPGPAQGGNGARCSLAGPSGRALTPFSPSSDRPQPPSKPVVQQEDVKACSVLLCWEPGSDGLSPVRYYTVQTRELPAGEWTLHSASVSHNATSFVVDR